MRVAAGRGSRPFVRPSVVCYGSAMKLIVGSSRPTDRWKLLYRTDRAGYKRAGCWLPAMGASSLARSLNGTTVGRICSVVR